MYTLFVPAVLLVAFLLWRKRRYGEFQYYAFLIAMGFLASYVGYLLVPARGPRFLLKHLQHIAVTGTVAVSTACRTRSTGWNRRITIVSPAATRNSPSWRGGRAGWSQIGCFGSISAYTLSIIFATVYLRYHYTVDLLAGAAVAVTLIVVAPSLYRRLQERA